MISGYCFGESFGFLEQVRSNEPYNPDHSTNITFSDIVLQENWQLNFRAPLYGALNAAYIFRFLPFVKVFVDMAPLFANWANEYISAMLKESNEEIPARVRKAKEEHEAGIKKDSPSIFSAVLDSSLPEQEKSGVRLGGEGFSIGAGTETDRSKSFCITGTNP